MKKKFMNTLSISSLLLLLMGCSDNASSISVIGGADGPTAAFVATQTNWVGLGVIAVAILMVVLTIYSKFKKK